jgi:hypothetical protein
MFRDESASRDDLRAAHWNKISGATRSALALFLIGGCALQRSAHAPESERPCSEVYSVPGPRDGYVVEWACGGNADAYNRVCPVPNHESEVPDLVLDWLVLRGTGSVHLGAALAPGLSPMLTRLESFGEIGPPQCVGGTLTVWLRDQREIDRATEIVGTYLRDHNADDRVIVNRMFKGGCCPAAGA